MGLPVKDKRGQTSYQKISVPKRAWVTDLAKAHGICTLEPEDAAGLAAMISASGKPADGAGLAAMSSASGKPASLQPKQFSGLTNVYGLVVVKPGKIGRGPLTPWSAEEQYLLDFVCSGPAAAEGMCSLEISGLMVFEKPFESHCPQRFKTDIWVPDKMSYEEFARCSGVGRDRDQLESKLGINREQIEAFLSKPVGLRVPFVPLQLIWKKAWKALVLDGADFGRTEPHFAGARELRQRMGFPPDDWVKRAVALGKRQDLGQLKDLESLRFQAVHAGKLAGFLREWADVILDHIPDEDAKMECQLKLEEHVLRLDSMQKAGQSVRTQRSKESLLRALCASMYLRDRSKLAETFRLTLGCAGVSETVGLQGELPKLPSSSQIGEAQIQIDAAFCCFWKSKFELFGKDCLIYMLADSSPQGGTDWLLSQMRVIDAKALEEIVKAQDFLQKSWGEFVSLVTSESEATPSLPAEDQPQTKAQEIVQERHAAGLLLKGKIITHRQIPMALGSGTGGSNLDQKLLCMCKKFIAETHRQKLTRQVMHRVVSFCTDLGTESGFAEQAEGYRLKDVLPEWMGDVGLEPEEDQALAAEEEADNAYLFANALSSPGLLHICFNMCDDIHRNLSQYAEWLPKFKALAAMLHHQHLRKRYLATCVLNTPFAWMASQLEKGIPKPAMWRWGTIQKALPQLLAKKRLLQLTWDERKFSSDLDSQQEAAEQPPRTDGDGGDGFDFTEGAVSAAVHSEAWWLYTCMLAKLNQFVADLTAWSEGCSCHPWLVQEQGFEARTTEKERASKFTASATTLPY